MITRVLSTAVLCLSNVKTNQYKRKLSFISEHTSSSVLNKWLAVHARKHPYMAAHSAVSIMQYTDDPGPAS